MTHARRWAVAAAALGALLAAACLALWVLVPDDDELARRVEAAFEERMGQKLVVGAVRWRVLGLPVVEVLDARTGQAEALAVKRIAIYPQLMPLWRKQLVINRLEVDGAVVPRNALAAYRGKTPQGNSGAVELRAVSFTNVTYISYSGIPVVYDGEIVQVPPAAARAAASPRCEAARHAGGHARRPHRRRCRHLPPAAGGGWWVGARAGAAGHLGRGPHDADG